MIPPSDQPEDAPTSDGAGVGGAREASQGGSQPDVSIFDGFGGGGVGDRCAMCCGHSACGADFGAEAEGAAP